MSKAYWCTPKDWDECSDLVFAENRNQAITFAMARGEACSECTYTEIRAIRNPSADKYALTPDAVRSDAIWREIGGSADVEEPRCDTCGLATMDNKWPLCDNCHNCIDCVGPMKGVYLELLCAECREETR